MNLVVAKEKLKIGDRKMFNKIGINVIFVIRRVILLRIVGIISLMIDMVNKGDI